MFTDTKHKMYPQQQMNVGYFPCTALHCIYNLLLIATLDSVNYCHQPHLAMAVHRPGLPVWSTHQANCCYHGYQHIIHTLVLAVGGVHTWKVSAWLGCCTIVIGNSTSQNVTGQCRGHLIQTFRPNPGSSSLRKDNDRKTSRRFYTQEWRNW